MSKCGGKVRHATFEAAKIVLKRQKNPGLSAYACGTCGGFHLGNSNRPEKILSRIDQLLARAGIKREKGQPTAIPQENKK